MSSFDNSPSAAWCYTLPPESAPRDALHYVVVQVSALRYVVAEYEGGGGALVLPDRTVAPTLRFRTVSEPLSYAAALALAAELRDKRIGWEPANRCVSGEPCDTRQGCSCRNCRAFGR